MPAINWQDPPPPNGGVKRGVDETFVKELRANPGSWAVWRENATSNLAVQIKNGMRAAFRPAGAFEATTRANGTSRVTIYVRYVGDPS